MIAVREFNLGEEDVVASIHNIAFRKWRKEFGYELADEFGYGSVNSNEILKWTSEAKAHLLIAERDGKIVGYAHIRLKETKGQSIVILEGEIVPMGPSMGQSRLAVLPKYRRTGVATALVKQAEGLFKAMDADFFVAYALSSNEPSCQLFKKLEFQRDPLYWYKPYSTLVPLYADGVYTELDLNKPLNRPKLNPHVSVREASIDDLEVLVKIWRRSFGVLRAGRAIDWLREMEVLLIAEHKGEAVGAMGCYSSGELSIPGVLPEYRRRGVGSTLFYHLLVRMKRTHTKAVAYTGLPFTDALRMYWRFGFNEKNRKIHFFKRF